MPVTVIKDPQFPTIVLNNESGRAEDMLALPEFTKAFAAYAGAANKLHRIGYTGIHLALGDLPYLGRFYPAGEFKFRDFVFADIFLYPPKNEILEKVPNKDCVQGFGFLKHPIMSRTPLEAVARLLEERAKILR